MRLKTVLFALVLAAAPAALSAAPVPPSIGADPPQDKAHPARMGAFALPSHGVNINAVLYVAAGAGPHPTVLLLHGLPGNEQNLDLAQAIRRSGWNVLTLHYRGSWGSPGDFTFAHCIEDAEAALALLHAPPTEAEGAIDSSKLVVIGHSMGGWISALVGARDPNVLGIGLISAANMGGQLGGAPTAVAVKVMDDNIGTSAGMHTVAATPQSLADEIVAKGKTWDAMNSVEGLRKHPLLVVTSDDGLGPTDDALAKAVGGKGVSRVHLATDHSYSDQRIALESTVVDWLATLPGAPAGR